MKNSVKKLVISTLAKYDISTVDLDAVKGMIITEGYMIIRFSSFGTSDSTRRLIKTLNQQERTSYCDSFTYNDRDHRIVFVRRDVSDDELMYLLSVELGRILTFKTECDGVIGISAEEDRIAHEFAYHICDIARHGVVYNIIKGYTVQSVTAGIALIFGICMLLSFLFIKGCTGQNNVFADNAAVLENSEKTDALPLPNIVETYDEDNNIAADDSVYDINSGFYATKNGKKYHTINCGYISGKDVHLVTSDDIASGKYSACTKCIR